ncbi:MAG: PKD domain-containing protein [Bacteroidota bacterium]
MKDNFEKAFKEKLENFEAPHDASAWEAMNDRLDAQQTPQTPTGSSALKWVLATTIVAAIAVTGVVLFNTTETAPEHNNELSDADAPKDQTSEPSPSDSNTSPEAVKSTPNEDQDSAHNAEPESSADAASQTPTTPETHSEPVPPEEDLASNGNGDSEASGDDVNNVPDGVQQSATNDTKYIAGRVSSNEICRGEEISIVNDGAKNEIVKLEINGEVKTLKKAHSLKLKPNASTDIRFLDETDSAIGAEKIRVNELPQPDFRYESNIFENGLPVTICEAYDDYEQMRWNFDGQSQKEGQKVKHHFFEKGKHDVTLQVTDNNGCVGEKTATVRIDKKYNLLAVDAFKPNSSNPKTNTFMPFSLTKRDVEFTLTIFDPNDNGVIYQTSDANEPWDGTDQRTRKMTPGETVYIWKVQLENPLPHERGVYAGTVVHN